MKLKPRKEQGRGQKGQPPRKALVPAVSFVSVGDNRWDIKHSEARHHCFGEVSSQPEKGFTMALSLPISLQIPGESTLSAVKISSCLERGAYRHLTPGDPEQLVTSLLLLCILSYCPGNFPGIEMLCFLIPRLFTFPRKPGDNSGHAGFVQGLHFCKPLSTSLPSVTHAVP